MNQQTKSIHQYYGFWKSNCECTPTVKKKLDRYSKTLELEGKKYKKVGYNVLNDWIFESIINNDALDISKKENNQ